MKIFTWNSQGLRLEAYKTRLAKKPNLMVVQEAGNLGETLGHHGLACDKAHYLGTFEDYHTYWVPWMRTTPDGNLRCSMAIFSDSVLESVKAKAIIDDSACQPRPLLSAVYKTHWAIGNIHAGGKDYIANVFTRMNQKYPMKELVIVGDFNQTPEEMKSISHPGRLNNLFAPDGATRPQSNKKIDLAVSTSSGRATFPMPDYGGSDHKTVEFEIEPPARLSGGRFG